MVPLLMERLRYVLFIIRLRSFYISIFKILTSENKYTSKRGKQNWQQKKDICACPLYRCMMHHLLDSHKHILIINKEAHVVLTDHVLWQIFLSRYPAKDQSTFRSALFYISGRAGTSASGLARIPLSPNGK